MFDLFEMYNCKAALYFKAYQHKVVKAVELMWVYLVSPIFMFWIQLYTVLKNNFVLLLVGVYFFFQIQQLLFYFEFNNKIYQQQEGLAMGSPLSSIIAEICLQYTDTKIQKANRKP